MPVQIGQLWTTTLAFLGLLPSRFPLSTAAFLFFLALKLSTLPLSLSWRIYCPPRLLFCVPAISLTAGRGVIRAPPGAPILPSSQHHPTPQPVAPPLKQVSPPLNPTALLLYLASPRPEPVRPPVEPVFLRQKRAMPPPTSAITAANAGCPPHTTGVTPPTAGCASPTISVTPLFYGDAPLTLISSSM